MKRACAPCLIRQRIIEAYGLVIRDVGDALGVDTRILGSLGETPESATKRWREAMLRAIKARHCEPMP